MHSRKRLLLASCCVVYCALILVACAITQAQPTTACWVELLPETDAPGPPFPYVVICSVGCVDSRGESGDVSDAKLFIANVEVPLEVTGVDQKGQYLFQGRVAALSPGELVNVWLSHPLIPWSGATLMVPYPSATLYSSPPLPNVGTPNTRTTYDLSWPYGEVSGYYVYVERSRAATADCESATDLWTETNQLSLPDRVLTFDDGSVVPFLTVRTWPVNSIDNEDDRNLRRVWLAGPGLVATNKP